MRGRKHSEAVQAQVLAALLAGQGVNEVAQKYNLAKSTVSNIKNGLSSDDIERVRTQKTESLAALVESHLTESLKAATEIARKVRTDKQWFAKQSAQEVAILYGVLTDKAVRILEAAEASGQTDPS